MSTRIEQTNKPDSRSNWKNMKINSWTPAESAAELANNGVTNPFGKNDLGQTVEQQILFIWNYPEIGDHSKHIGYLIALQHHTPDAARKMIHGDRSKKRS